MPLVAVARDKFAVAVGTTNARPPLAVYEQLELVESLHRTYGSDAHVVGYIDTARTDGRQQRWSKTASDLSSLVTNVIFIDVDNPGHAPWTDEERSRAIAQYSSSSLPFGVYHTTGGARFVFTLETPVPVTKAEPLIRRIMWILDREGFGVDYGAKDWTRHMRMPNVVRSGRPFATPFMDLSRMAPVTVEPLDIPTRQRPSRHRPNLPAIPFSPSLADHWQARARVIGAAVAGGVTAEFHAMYLAIGGALLQRQVPPEHVPELVRLIAIAAASSKPGHHEKSARDTVARYLSGQPVTGLRDLTLHHPLVADAVHDALADARDIHIRSQSAEPAPAPTPLAVTTAALERTIRDAPDGLTVVVAECGLGKTAAAMRVAKSRAESKNPDAKRAPMATKTAISVDKNELAQQIAGDLAAAGVPVRRVFGPLSVLDDRGQPVCKLHANALPLVEGGQSVTWEFCLGRGQYKCPHYDECPAREGFEDTLPSSDASPRVTVGTHALLHQLDGAAGNTGLLVIDEPPPLLEALTILPADVELALHNIASFQRDFAEAMTPVLLAMQRWSAEPELTFEDLTDTLERPPTVDANDRAITRPPLRADVARMCRADVVLARIVGKSSSVLRALFRAMTNADATVRLEADPERIVVTAPREDLAAALRREGAVVAMDANADLHLPAFTKVVGYDPPVHRFLAEDGARIERTMIRCGSATRRSWLSHGRLVLDTGLFAALRAIATWADECAAVVGRPVDLGVITIRLVETVIRYAQGEDVVADWVKQRQSTKTLTDAAETLRAIFASPNIRRPIALAHYGATRGLNRLAGVDCLATVGDPWPNLSDVQATSTYLAIADWEGRLEDTARAELEQAHGRLRTVHRTTPGFALHVGRVLPGGSGWRALATSTVSPPVRATSLQGGRPPAGAPMPAGELAGIVERLGGLRSAARAVGCSHSTLHRYLAGQGVPPGVASTLRRLGTEGLHGTAAE